MDRPFPLKKWMVFVLMPLLIGLLFYWLVRPVHTISFFSCLPPPPFHLNALLPDLLVDGMPSFCWSFSLTAALLCLWNPQNIVKGSLISSIAILFCVSFEVLQFFHWIPGTFDWLDVCMSLLAGILALLLVNFKKDKILLNRSSS